MPRHRGRQHHHEKKEREREREKEKERERERNEPRYRMIQVDGYGQMREKNVVFWTRLLSVSMGFMVIGIFHMLKQAFVFGFHDNFGPLIGVFVLILGIFRLRERRIEVLWIREVPDWPSLLIATMMDSCPLVTFKVLEAMINHIKYYFINRVQDRHLSPFDQFVMPILPVIGYLVIAIAVPLLMAYCYIVLGEIDERYLKVVRQKQEQRDKEKLQQQQQDQLLMQQNRNRH